MTRLAGCVVLISLVVLVVSSVIEMPQSISTTMPKYPADSSSVEFRLKSGESATKNIVMTATGTPVLLIDNFRLENPNDWIEIGTQRLVIEKPNEYHLLEIPVTVTVPEDYVGTGTVAAVLVDARLDSGAPIHTASSISVVVDNTVFDPIPIIALAAIAGGAAGIAI